MDPLLDQFVDALWLEDGLARNTLTAYRRDLAALGRWLAARGASLEAASEADLAAYMASEHTATRATTANRRMAVLRRFYRWAQRERIVAADPTVRLRSARRPARFPQIDQRDSGGVVARRARRHNRRSDCAIGRCSSCFMRPDCESPNWSD